MDNLFTDSRYNRQELMPQLGPEAQVKLSRAKVAVIGAGGVKSPLLYYLVAAGVGHIRIIDFDKVELSNLNRQILFDEKDIGSNKAIAAAKRLKQLNSEIDIESIDDRITEKNIDFYLDDFSIIVEGGDSEAGRVLVNDYCLKTKKPMVHPSAQFGYGYCFSVIPKEKTACFKCVFPELPEGHGGSVPVYGVTTGISGSVGAGEVIKLITGRGRPIINGMWYFSSFSSDFRLSKRKRNENCPACAKYYRI